MTIRSARWSCLGVAVSDDHRLVPVHEHKVSVQVEDEVGVQVDVCAQFVDDLGKPRLMDDAARFLVPRSCRSW